MDNAISEILTRGVQEVYVKNELEEALKSERKLRIYYGVDPSGAVIHLGHAVLLRKLQLLQELGHKIIFLIGDFTGMIGDPTDKAAVRQPLTRKQVLENAKTYKKQVSKFLNFSGKNPAEVSFNSKWNDKLTFKNIIELSAKFTVQQLLERDMFEKRMAESKPIGLHEFLYPLVQGYDAVMLDADLQVGGTDQTFNMLQGRNLMRSLKNKTQMVLTCELLVGTDGRKMSKSFNNVIAIEDEPNDMFGKVMSINDSLIKKYFLLATRVDIRDIDDIMKLSNPRDQKIVLAEKITALYHGIAAAEKAKQAFIDQFSKGQLPEDIEIKLVPGGMQKITTTVAGILGISNSEVRRLMDQGGLKLDGEVVKKDGEIEVTDKEKLLQAGKRRIYKFKKQ